MLKTTQILICMTLSVMPGTQASLGDGTLPPVYQLLLDGGDTQPPTTDPLPPISGPTIVADSCSAQDVQAAIDITSDGETVVIPAGSCVWTTTVNLNAHDKSIRLAGAGENHTLITASTSPALELSGIAPFRWEVSGFTMIANSGGNYMVGISGSANNWRVHNLSFTQLGNPVFVFNIFGGTYGLMDHLSASGQNSGIISIIGPNGSAWVDPAFNQWGADKAVFLEDSNINITGMNEGRFTIDCQNSGRYVMRNNTIKNQRTGNHGLDTGGYYSCLSAEIYNNTIEFDFDTSDGAIFWRGGSALFHGNRFNYTPELFAFAHIRFDNFRSNPNVTNLSWPRCDGTRYKFGNNTWNQALVMGANEAFKVCSGNRMRTCSTDSTCDLNGEGSCSEFVDGTVTGPDGVNSYPCFQQVGRGLNNSLNPVYLWNNTYTGAQGNGGFQCPTGQVCAAESVSSINSIMENRDYFIGIPKPGYTPYTYPHPLQNR